MICIFGVWLVAANINYLYSDEERLWVDKPIPKCVIVFNTTALGVQIRNHTCDEVAEEINRLTKSKVQEGK